VGRCDAVAVDGCGDCLWRYGGALFTLCRSVFFFGFRRAYDVAITQRRAPRRAPTALSANGLHQQAGIFLAHMVRQTLRMYMLFITAARIVRHGTRTVCGS